METSIELMVTSYIITRIGILAVIGYFVYRVLRSTPDDAGIQPHMIPKKVSTSTRRFAL